MTESTDSQINKSTAQQGEVLVKVEGVSKKFCKDLKRSLWYGIRDIASDLFGLKKNQEQVCFPMIQYFYVFMTYVLLFFS